MSTNRYPMNKGFLGIGKQTVKGTPVAPTQFIRLSDSTTLTPTIEYDTQRETGDGIYPGHTIKTSQKVDGSFSLNARPDVLTLLIGSMFGSDIVTGETAPYTHVMKPNEDPSQVPWVTLVRNVGGVIQEKIADCRVKEIKLSGESGNRITAAVSFLGLDGKKNTDTITPTYSDDVPFIFYQGSYSKDGQSIATIKKFEITLTAVVEDSDQTVNIILADAAVIRFEVAVAMTLKVTSANKDEYFNVYYDNNGDVKETLQNGSIDISLTYGSGATERGLSISVPRLLYTQQPLEVNPSSDESQSFEVSAIAEYDDVTSSLVTITTKTQTA